MSREDDKRRHDRFSADNVRGSFSYSVQASVLNISLGGLALRTNTQLKIGREYSFRMGTQADAVQLTGSVRWCRMSGTERQESGDVVPVYEAGVSFDDVLTDTATELLQFMEKTIILDLKRRIAGRFKVGSGDPLVLKSGSGFEVKQISLSGMMIVSDVSLRPETVLELEVRLGRRKFATRARIIYEDEITAENEEPSYRMGVEFLETPKAKMEILEGFIRTELNLEDKLSGDE